MIPVIQKIDTTGDILSARFGHTMLPGTFERQTSSWEGEDGAVWRSYRRH